MRTNKLLKLSVQRNRPKKRKLKLPMICAWQKSLKAKVSPKQSKLLKKLDKKKMKSIRHAELKRESVLRLKD